MNHLSTSLIRDQSCDQAVAWVTRQLRQAGLFAMRTFDLQVARCSRLPCPCPYHGTELCECQMVVLLVYPAAGKPVTLVAQGDKQQTEFMLVDTPQQRVDPRVEAAIRRCFLLPGNAAAERPSF